MIRSNPSSGSIPPASPTLTAKEDLAAQIRQLQEEIALKQVENDIKNSEALALQGDDEILQMEAAMMSSGGQTSSVAMSAQTPAMYPQDAETQLLDAEIEHMEQQIEIRKVRKTRRVKRKKKKKISSASSVVSTESAFTTGSTVMSGVSIATVEKERLEEEIRQMEAMIEAAKRKKVLKKKKLPSPTNNGVSVSIVFDSSVEAPSGMITGPPLLTAIDEAQTPIDAHSVISEPPQAPQHETVKPARPQGPAFLASIKAMGSIEPSVEGQGQADTPPSRPQGPAFLNSIKALGSIEPSVEAQGQASASPVRPQGPAFLSSIKDMGSIKPSVEGQGQASAARPQGPAFLASIKALGSIAPSAEGQGQQNEDLQSSILSATLKPATERKLPEAAPSGPPPRPNFLAAIAQAATAREERLEETGGELIMQEFEPEVAETRKTTPQLSFDLAEMITKKARDREARLEAGGEKKMTIIKEKEEYKKDFSNICIEAAETGRLTRLNEHIVEAMAQEKTPEQEWKSNGLLAITWRSNHMSVIHEAANVGDQTKMKEHVAANYDVEEEEAEALAAEEALSPRLQQLLELNTVVGTGDQKVDQLLTGLREETAGGDSMLIRPLEFYQNIADVQLPKARPPIINVAKHRQKVKEMLEEAAREHRPMMDISQDVARFAWERRMRLNRPNSMPKVKDACPCPYCGTASPFQTHAYKVSEKKHQIIQKEREEKARIDRERRQEEMRARREAMAAKMEVEREQQGQSYCEEIQEPERIAPSRPAATAAAPQVGSAATMFKPQSKYVPQPTTFVPATSTTSKPAIASASINASARPSTPTAEASQGCACIIL